jgi:predicted O-methyltransferase YrrM
MGMHYSDPVCQVGHEHTQPMPESISTEEGDLLYALVRMTKPRVCAETGAGRAISTVRIGLALRNNEVGMLYSCDTNPDLVEIACEMLRDLPVFIGCMRGIDLLRQEKEWDFIFVDSGWPAERADEINYICTEKALKPGGLLVVHDVLNDYKDGDGNYRAYLADELNKTNWPSVVLESLAGIAIYRRME